jgi:alcohol dehydrogenase (cytochrome c)
VPVEEVLASLRLNTAADKSKPVAIGQIQAWDLKSGKQAWSHSFSDSANWGPIMTTGGNLLFAGGTSDRAFRALDAGTGKVLWQMKLNSGVIGVPSSFMVDGVQYIAVQAGWGVDSERMLNGLATLMPDRIKANAPQGGVVWVFALKDRVTR